MKPGDADLAGRVGIVTGGAGGIGQAVVAAAEERGALVATFDRRPGPAKLALECDVTDESQVAAAAAEVEERLGPVEFLVCAAGVVTEAAVAELTVPEWRDVVDVSMLGTFLAARAVLPTMVARKRGRIVALSSGLGTKGSPGGAHYAAAKAGVEGFVKSLALEVAPDGITVNAVAPGPITTAMTAHLDARAGWRVEMEHAIPLGRVGEPNDVVGPVLFLLGPAASYITGQVLHVNGGLLMP
jgi:NAD(P)-dependent dehydrogenase (short-subunit alcohol dehydrogenase family)